MLFYSYTRYFVALCLSFVGIFFYLLFKNPCIKNDSINDTTGDRAKEYELTLTIGAIVAVSVLVALLDPNTALAILSVFIVSSLIVYIYVIWIGKAVKQDICSTDAKSSALQGITLASFAFVGVLIVLITMNYMLPNIFTQIENANKSLSAARSAMTNVSDLTDIYLI